jgi:DNA-binding CsgD family transcriptional regulator
MRTLIAEGSIPNPGHDADSAARQLLQTVVKLSECRRPLADLRRETLEELAALAQADAGHWSWGRGHPASASITPVAFIHFGYTDNELAATSRFGLHPRMREEFALPLVKLMRPNNVACALRRDIVSDECWTTENWLYRNVHETGMNSWIQAVRYAANDTWSNMYLARRIREPEFGLSERAIAELAISSIPWLWAHPHEAAPAEAVKALSPRQRAVMLQVLDGLSRKKIAKRLGISEETVNHHLKAVFRHFSVQSATELAALFLRSR